MCGRLFQKTPAAEAARIFATANPVPNIPPRYNAAPTQDVLAVRFNPETGQRSLDLLHWGLIPIWAKDRSIASRLINARSEGIDKKPSFADAFRRRRCLVPADGFYEWKKDGKHREPFAVTMRDGGLFAFAGLWERWRGEGGEIVRSFTIVTTAANDLLSPIHERMPVIVDPADYDRWLGAAPADEAELHALMKPFPAERMRVYPVDPAVGNVRNDDPHLIEPMAAMAPAGEPAGANPA
jgi:putative SOS response-associated peptidase YedK